MSKFALPLDGAEQETGSTFRPKFDANGLVTAVACDAATGEVLMLAHMNDEALEKTLQSGKAHYWSRSRKAIWLKGESSGNVQMVQEMRTDCDQDAIVMKVIVEGDKASCHTCRVSCFFRTVGRGEDGSFKLATENRPALFDPATVYKCDG